MPVGRPGRQDPATAASIADPVLAKRARECGVDTKITIYPVPTHAFDIFWTFLPEAMNALDEIGRFIRHQIAANAGAAADHG